MIKYVSKKVRTIEDAAEEEKKEREKDIDDVIAEFEKELEARVTPVTQMITLDQLPERVEAVIADVPQFKLDRRGAEALFITLITKDEKVIVQKYTPSAWFEVYSAFKRCGGVKKLMQNYTTWIKKHIGRQRFERLLPICEEELKKK